MPTARVLAQAKINVWLDVVRPRPDGYHDIFTLFHRLDLADELTLRIPPAGSRALTVTGPRVPTAGLGPPETNLAYRAAEAFRAHTGWPGGFEIELVKHIPVGAGLGGGSADAGAVLRALNAMAPHPIDAGDLQIVARSLGADVPFLASELVAAIGAGRGDLLQRSPFDLPAADVLLIVPPFGISTAEAYGWLRETKSYARAAAQPVTDPSPETSSWRAVDHGNTFEQVVGARYPVIRDYRTQLLAAGAALARMSGSGSTVFGAFESGIPEDLELEIDALVIPTRAAKSVVQVEVRE